MKTFVIFLAVCIYSNLLTAGQNANDNMNALFPVGNKLKVTDNMPSQQLFTNGKIYINADQRVANLFVVDGVVARYNVAPEEYPQAEIIDLKGKTAYPGFNDSHVH